MPYRTYPPSGIKKSPYTPTPLSSSKDESGVGVYGDFFDQWLNHYPFCFIKVSLFLCIRDGYIIIVLLVNSVLNNNDTAVM